MNTALFARWMQPKQEALAEEAVPDDTPQEEAVERQVAAIQQEYQAAKTEEAPAEENASRVYLAVPYEEKEEAKALGAKWDKANKSWFMESSNANLPAASKWLPEKQQTQSMPAMSPVEEFADKLREMGCVVANGHPFMDGQKHRIETVGDKKASAAAFMLVIWTATRQATSKTTGRERKLSGRRRDTACLRRKKPSWPPRPRRNCKCGASRKNRLRRLLSAVSNTTWKATCPFKQAHLI